MKKYLGLTKMEARKKIRERTKEVVDDKGINEMVIEELNKKGKEIEYFDISVNVNENCTTCANENCTTYK
jgi:hypothetical protein